MYWNNLIDLVEEFFQLDKVNVLYVLCPFINTELIEKLLLEQEEVVIVTSWRKDHLLAGVSSLSLFELVKKHPKWTLRINDRLHAKVFTRSFEDMLYGSANLTHRALEDKERSNFEVMNYAKCTQKDEMEILEIINQSLQITESEYQQYLRWYEENKDKYKFPPQESVIEPVLFEKEFLISSLPGSISPRRIWNIMSEHQEWDDSWNEKSAAQHDLHTFKLDCSDFDTFEQFLNEMKVKVSSHPFIDSFCQRIDENGLYFGSAKQWIQETCIDDPVPYRKEITGYVQSLFSWLVELYPERYIIEQPNYSQVIRRIDL
jgi:hypothetical protein